MSQISNNPNKSTEQLLRQKNSNYNKSYTTLEELSQSKQSHQAPTRGSVSEYQVKKRNKVSRAKPHCIALLHLHCLILLCIIILLPLLHPKSLMKKPFKLSTALTTTDTDPNDLFFLISSFKVWGLPALVQKWSSQLFGPSIISRSF